MDKPRQKPYLVCSLSIGRLVARLVSGDFLSGCHRQSRAPGVELSPRTSLRPLEARLLLGTNRISQPPHAAIAPILIGAHGPRGDNSSIVASSQAMSAALAPLHHFQVVAHNKGTWCFICVFSATNNSFGSTIIFDPLVFVYCRWVVPAGKLSFDGKDMGREAKRVL